MSTNPTNHPSREALLRLNASAGDLLEDRTDAELLEDADGRPTGVGEPFRRLTFFAGAIVTEGDLAAAGLTRADVPHLHVIDNPEEN